MSERKDFEPWKVEVVYKQQDGVCAKCGNPLLPGFHRHHKDGDNTNNAIENLELFCMNCHGSELFKTLQEQKKKHLTELDSMVQMSLDGKLSGAAADKLLDAIKLALSLERQVYGAEVEEAPASIRLESYTTVTEHGLREYEKGIKEGIFKGIDYVFDILTQKDPMLVFEELLKKRNDVYKGLSGKGFTIKDKDAEDFIEQNEKPLTSEEKSHLKECLKIYRKNPITKKKDKYNINKR